MDRHELQVLHLGRQLDARGRHLKISHISSVSHWALNPEQSAQLVILQEFSTLCQMSPSILLLCSCTSTPSSHRCMQVECRETRRALSTGVGHGVQLSRKLQRLQRHCCSSGSIVDCSRHLEIQEAVLRGDQRHHAVDALQLVHQGLQRTLFYHDTEARYPSKLFDRETRFGGIK